MEVNIKFVLLILFGLIISIFIGCKEQIIEGNIKDNNGLDICNFKIESAIPNNPGDINRGKCDIYWSYNKNVDLMPIYLKTLKNSKNASIMKSKNGIIIISINPVEDDSIVLEYSDTNNPSGQCIYYGFSGKETIGSFAIEFKK